MQVHQLHKRLSNRAMLMDTRWYGYNVPVGAYTVISKSQKCRQLCNGLMARLRNESVNAKKIATQAHHMEDEMELDLVEQVPTILIEMAR